jgi:superfamily II DNA or RNA helicase
MILNRSIQARNEEQAKAIAAVIQELRARERAQYQMTMGAGKTFVAIKVADAYARVVVFVPTLVLRDQFIADCRAAGVNRDLVALDHRELGDVHQIVTLFRDGTRPILVATYAAQRKVIEASRRASIDLVIADESHRTTGSDDKAWGAFLTELRARRFLFQTGTVRTFAPQLRRSGGVRDQLDERLYGRCVYTLSMARAIDRTIVQNYRVSVLVDCAGMLSKGEREITRGRNWPAHTRPTRTANEFEIALIGGALRACVKNGHKKLLAYARSIEDVRFYTELIPRVSSALHRHDGNIPRLQHGQDVFGIWRNHSKLERQTVLASFARRPSLSVLVSCRTLTEGVSIPCVDAALMLAPRRSQIDIAQIVGRTQRLHATKQKPSLIIVPAIVSSVCEVNGRTDLLELRRTLYALAHYDESWKLEQNALAEFAQGSDTIREVRLSPRLEFLTPPRRVDALSRMRLTLLLSSEQAARVRFKKKHDAYVELVRGGRPIPRELVSFRQDVVARKISPRGFNMDPLFLQDWLVLRTAATAARIVAALSVSETLPRELRPALRGHRDSYARGTLAPEVLDVYARAGRERLITDWSYALRTARRTARQEQSAAVEEARRVATTIRKIERSDIAAAAIRRVVDDFNRGEASSVSRRILALDRIQFWRKTLSPARLAAYRHAGGLNLLRPPLRRGKWIPDAEFERRVISLRDWIQTTGAPPKFATTGLGAFFASLRSGDTKRTRSRVRILRQHGVLEFVRLPRAELIALQRARGTKRQKDTFRAG